MYTPTPHGFIPVPVQLPQYIGATPTLQEILAHLPTPYGNILGDINLPIDDGLAISKAITNGNLTIYSDSTVLEGCRAHTFTLCTESDHDNEAVTGSAPTSGDPDTMSSLCTEHFRYFAGILVVWAVVQKYHISSGHVNGAVDNMVVVQ